nr:helix-turn-helix domain-containing protein [Sulfurihydrogenibium subterraneum]
MQHYQKTKNVSKTCRYFGISRNTFYKWLKGYEKEKDKKRLASTSPRRCSADRRKTHKHHR